MIEFVVIGIPLLILFYIFVWNARRPRKWRYLNKKYPMAGYWENWRVSRFKP